ncbi:MAG: Gfo/Idh/MocA family oxidoreductase [Bryobacterales bacterium]|nr:Gfo/Idh/MocA family oxidoreductase [Bryobacterales bacterium]
MPNPLQMAVIGQGRIGVLHSLHVQEVANESGACRLSAVVDTRMDRAEAAAARLSRSQSTPVRPFPSIAAMLESGAAEASLIATPTDCHRSNAAELVAAGHRVLLEKPLTGSLEEDREFARDLDAHHPNAVMLAFQRRFDAPLRHARRLMEEGAIGRVFKVVSILEDSNPAPDGYVSGGILADMSVHNVDEILWLLGRTPTAAAAIGNCLYSRKLSTAVEDYDDAFLYLWFPSELAAQVSVTRNHVSGYRVETWIFGEKGQIHVGRFEQKPRDIVVEAYGRGETIAHQIYKQRDYGRRLPEFVDRFGHAYKAEVAEFVERCNTGAPFSVTHNDGLRAMEVIHMGSQRFVTPHAGEKP